MSLATDRQACLGFTLVELMLVMAIMCILLGMLMPLLNLTRRTAKQSAAACTMAKIDVALRAFRSDAGHLPWTATPASSDGQWGNELAYRLGHVLTADERTALSLDLTAVGSAYNAGGECIITNAMLDQPASLNTSPSPKGAWTTSQVKTRVAIALNRLAVERGRVGVLSGNIGIVATMPNGGVPWQDGSAILANPRSRGWSDDYLAGELVAGECAGDAILDPWGHPYVYFHPVVNGVVGYVPQAVEANGNTLAIITAWFGLQMRTRSVTNALNSDMRTHGAAAVIASEELWSAGADGLFSAHRTEATNRDNIPASTSYLRGLQ